LQAYKVDQILVFSNKGTEAKMLAAPLIRPWHEWREDVAAWVALRSERAADLDHLLDPAATEPYVHKPDVD